MKANNNNFSEIITVFQNRNAPEAGYLAGYGALISNYHLKVPLPEVLSLISQKHKQYTVGGWQVFTTRHQPLNNLNGHLTFALKYDGIDLFILKKIFNPN